MNQPSKLFRVHFLSIKLLMNWLQRTRCVKYATQHASTWHYSLSSLIGSTSEWSVWTTGAAVTKQKLSLPSWQTTSINGAIVSDGSFTSGFISWCRALFCTKVAADNLPVQVFMFVVRQSSHVPSAWLKTRRCDKSKFLSSFLLAEWRIGLEFEKLWRINVVNEKKMYVKTPRVKFGFRSWIWTVQVPWSAPLETNRSDCSRTIYGIYLTISQKTGLSNECI